MKYWVTLALAIVISLAQEPAQQRKNTDGEVQGTDAAAKQLKLKADTGAVYTVNTDEKTNFIRVGPDLDIKKATKIALPDINSGDRVRARGVVSEDAKTISASTVIVLTKTDLAQKQLKDREEWIKRGVSGTVTAVNPDTYEITIKTDSIPPKTVVVDASNKVEFRRYAPDSVKFSDAKPSTFADLKVGDRLRALADKNEDGTRYKAEEVVSGSFRTVAAQVVAVDAAANTIKATDLTTKSKTPLTIHLNADTTLRRMSERMATFMAMRLNRQQAGTPGAGPAGGEDRSRLRAGGPGGPAGNMAQMGGGRSGQGGDLQQILERLPPVSLADLKPGDALIISSTNGTDRSNLMAITIVAGVEPFLAAAPKSAGALNLGSWNFDIGMPAQ